MSQPSAVCLKADARRLEARYWHGWLDEASRLAARFDNELEGDDPFAYNETASISLLAAAAARTGALGLAEFTVAKKAAHDRRHRALGRSDFWMLGPDRSWGFEFKQLSGLVTADRLGARLEEARGDARCITEHEADVAVAGLVVSLFYVQPDKREAAIMALETFSHKAMFAWRLDVHTGGANTYLFFDIVR